MASNLEVMSIVAEFGQQQWSHTNFWLSDRTLRSRDRILEFSQELVKIYAAANYFNFCVYFGMSGWYKQPLNESSSASPGGSQQLEIPPSPNSKRSANFFQILWFFTRRGDFNAQQDSIVCLYFCKTPTFCKSAYFSVRRQHFPNPPIFL